MPSATRQPLDLPPRPLRWLFLDLNSYFASVEQQLQPSLRAKPVIVAPVGSDTTVAIAANRLLAKLASDLKKPDGLVVFEADSLPQSLYSLGLREIAGTGARMERRLARDGVNDIRQSCERAPRDAGDAWGGTDGERLWYLLHGVDLPEKATQSRTIGHSHVLSP